MSDGSPYRLLGSRLVYEDRFARVRQDEVVHPGGRTGPFLHIAIKPGATVLALTEDRHAYFVREYKYGLQRHALELPGGGIDPGEEPLQAAQRELREEAGLVARQWVAMGRIDPLPSLVDCPLHLYLALGLTPVPREPDEGEILEVLRLPLEEALERQRAGEIAHAATCVLLLRTAEWLRREGS